MRWKLRMIFLLFASLVLAAPPARGQGKKAETPEQKRLMNFWEDHYESLRRYYEGVQAAQVADALSKPPPASPAAPCNH